MLKGLCHNDATYLNILSPGACCLKFSVSIFIDYLYVNDKHFDRSIHK